MDAEVTANEDPLNADFQTGFDINVSSRNLLKIRNEQEINREKITSDRINNTFFHCLLQTVQYGTWDGTPAALLVLQLHFGFRDGCRDRYTGASVEIEFEETLDAFFQDPDPRNKNNDPVVKLHAPVRVYGNPNKEEHVSKWSLEGNLTYQIPLGPQPSVTPHKEHEISFERHRRMWINSDADSDDDHRYHNRVVLTTGENKVEETGILHEIPTVMVITMPQEPKHGMKMRVAVTPHVAFSMNPIRLFQRRDDPIFLDRKRPKGPQYEVGKDFSDSGFQWDKIVKIPTEYQNSLY